MSNSSPPEKPVLPPRMPGEPPPKPGVAPLPLEPTREKTPPGEEPEGSRSPTMSA